MADVSTLKGFLVSFGYVEDTASTQKAVSSHAATEKKVTATNQAEIDKRQKIEDKAGARREKKADDAFKRDAQRNKAVLTDVEKGLVRIETFATRVAGAMGAIGGALAGTAAFTTIAGVAKSYSRLLTESRNSGASPKNIEALIFSLGQRGVEKGSARSSFDAFARTIQASPGMKAMLSGTGIDVNDDTAKVFSQLGRYFKSMPPQTALAMAGKYGIQDQSVLNALIKGDVGEGMQQYGNIAGSFGLDPDEASKNAREFSNAYDHLAEDLKAIQGKIADNFFKPLTTAMTGLSSMLEGNGGKVTALGTAFEALALAMSLRVIPPLLKITGLLDLLKAPVWLLRLLGVGSATAGAAAGAALLASTEPLNAGEPALGPDGRLHQLGPDGKPTGAALSGPWDGKTRGGGRAALGRHLGMEPDTRNWWQRTMPKALGGQDGPARATLGRSVRAAANDDPEIVDYIRQAAAARGIDPDTALSIAGHEGLHGFDPNRPDPGGDAGTSFSPWQMHFASNKPGYTLPGLGNDMLRETGVDPRDPKNWRATTDYALDYAKKHGWSPWHGRIPAHIGVWDGIGTYKAPPKIAAPPPTLKRSDVKTDANGNALNPDGTPTTSNFDPKTGMVTAPGPQSYNHRGDTNYTQHIHVTGVQRPQEVADAVLPVARRGAQDHIRFIEGASV